MRRRPCLLCMMDTEVTHTGCISAVSYFSEYITHFCEVLLCFSPFHCLLFYTPLWALCLHSPILITYVSHCCYVGEEVALYCSKYLPDIIKEQKTYKDGKLQKVRRRKRYNMCCVKQVLQSKDLYDLICATWNWMSIVRILFKLTLLIDSETHGYFFEKINPYKGCGCLPAGENINNKQTIFVTSGCQPFSNLCYLAVSNLCHASFWLPGLN